MRPRVLLFAVVAVLAGPLLASVSGAEPRRPYDEFEDVVDIAPTATSLRWCWGGDGAYLADRWRIWLAGGSRAPDRDGAPVARLRRGKQCYRARGLEKNTTYTISIVGSNEAGNGTVGTFTAATRRGGDYVSAPNKATRFRRSSGVGVVTAVVGRPAVAHAVYQEQLKPRPGSRRVRFRLVHTVHGRGGWTEPVRLARRIDGRAFLAGNPDGALVVAWNRFTEPRYRYRPAGATRFQAEATIPLPFAHLEAVALDNAGHLHFLLTATVGDGPGLHYRTNASGTWTETRVDVPCGTLDNGTCAHALMTYDRVSDRLALAATPRRGHIAVADKPATATQFGPPQVRYRPGPEGTRLVPTSIASRAGQITVGLRSPERWEGRGKARHPRDGLFLMTGSASERVGPPVRVPGTRRRDVGPLLVAATRSRRVVLAWQRGGVDRPRPLWDPRRQGIWLRRGSWHPQTALWSWGKRRHRTDSPYDALDSLAVRPRGRARVGFNRSSVG